MLIFLCGFPAAALAAGLACRLSLRNQKLLLNILAVLFPLSELWKQLLLTWTNGGAYRWWYFPFQLCSMPLYLLPLRQLLVLGRARERRRMGETRSPIRRDTAGSERQSRSLPAAPPSPAPSPARSPAAFLILTLTDFLADFGLLAGIFAFADQTGMRYGIPALTLHSYLWHFAMIFLGLFLNLSRCAREEYSSGFPGARKSGGKIRRMLSGFLPAAVLFLILAGIAELLNFLLRSKGSVDMFYISPWEPSTQVILRDIAARFGRGMEILLYLGLILFGAGLLHLCSSCLRRLLSAA